jgi:hypothetical protein
MKGMEQDVLSMIARFAWKEESELLSSSVSSSSYGKSIIDTGLS